MRQRPASSLTVAPDRLQPLLGQQEHLSQLGWCISVVLTLTYFIPEHNRVESCKRQPPLGRFQAAHSSGACAAAGAEGITTNAFFGDAVLIFPAKLSSWTPVSAAAYLLSS